MGLSDVIDDQRILAKCATLGGFAATLVTLYWWYKGFRLRVVGDAKSIAWCQENVLGNYLSHFSSRNILYSGFQIPYCNVTSVFGVRGWLIVQIFLWALIVVLVYRTGAVLIDERTGLIAGLFLAVTWETFRFAVRPQSDLMFLFAISLVFFTFAKWRATDGKRWYVLSLLSLALLSITRPFGFPILVGWVGWFLIRPGHSNGVDLRSRRTQALIILVGLVGIAVLMFFLGTQLNAAHTDPSVHWRKSLVAKWANGIVVTHPGTPTFEYSYTPRAASGLIRWMALNADHLLGMSLLKFAFFFVPILPRWSTFHIVVNTATIFPLMVGAFVGTWTLYRQRAYDLLAFIVAPALMVTFTVAVTFLDGGFNYRAPATLSFVLLTGLTITSGLKYWERAS